MRITLAVSPILLAALLSSPLHAQTFIGIGTDPFAETETIDFVDTSIYHEQTFTAPSEATHLRSFSFWFQGATRDEFQGYFTTFSIFELGVAETLDQTVHGRYDLFFEALGVTSGATYTVEFYSDHCSTENPDCLDPTVAGNLGDVFMSPTLELAIGDTYAGGEFFPYPFFPTPDGPRDLRFEATFIAVPEPGTLLLLLTGLVGIGVVARNRDRSARARIS